MLWVRMVDGLWGSSSMTSVRTWEAWQTAHKLSGPLCEPTDSTNLKLLKGLRHQASAHIYHLSRDPLSTVTCVSHVWV